jgi:hypothetical protein
MLAELAEFDEMAESVYDELGEENYLLKMSVGSGTIIH